MKVLFKKLRDNFEMPVKKFDAACYDVKVCYIEVMADGLIICHLGFSTEIPKGYKGVIVPRSGITNTAWIMQNSPGQIDCDYRGEWQVRFRCIEDVNYMSFPYKSGDRVAQIYFEKVEEVQLELSTELTDTERGSGGFGHTGL